MEVFLSFIIYENIMTYDFSSFLLFFPRMCLPCYSHEVLRACIADRPTREEQNEQNEHRSDALTNAERVKTGPNFR